MSKKFPSKTLSPNRTAWESAEAAGKQRPGSKAKRKNMGLSLEPELFERLENAVANAGVLRTSWIKRAVINKLEKPEATMKPVKKTGVRRYRRSFELPHRDQPSNSYQNRRKIGTGFHVEMDLYKEIAQACRSENKSRTAWLTEAIEEHLDLTASLHAFPDDPDP